MLDLMSVTHRTGRDTVLERASLRIAPGRVCVVLAPAGHGRSGLLKLVSGQERPQEGSVRFGKDDAAKSAVLKRRLAWARKHGIEPTSRKVRHVLGQAARRAGLQGGAVELEASRAAMAAGLGGQMQTQVKELDLEARIRLQLAVAAASRPAMLIVDDPLADLEPDARARMLVDLHAMLSECGSVVVVYATHSPDEARAIGGDLIVIDQGRIAQSGHSDDVLDHPRDLATARATAFPRLNMLQVVWAGGAYRLADGSTFTAPPGLALPSETSFTIAFNPEHATPVRHDADAVRFLVRGHGGETVGDIRFAKVAFAGADWLMGMPEAGDPAPGVMLNAFIDRDRVMVFGADGLAFGRATAIRAAS